LLDRYLASQRLPRTVRRTVQLLLWSRIDELSSLRLSLTSLVAQEWVIEYHQIEALSSAWIAAADATIAFQEEIDDLDEEIEDLVRGPRQVLNLLA
jgi:hypothetical protein